MDETRLGEALGRVLLPVGLFIWGMHKCQTMAERPRANRDSLRGLMIVLGGWALMLLWSVFSGILPRALGVVGLAVVTLMCLAGAVVSLKGLLSASQYAEGNGQGLLGLFVGLGLAGMLVFSFTSGMRRDVKSVEFLGELASDANRRLPRTLDEETELTSLEAQPALLLHRYRLLRRTRAEVDGARLTAAMKAQLTKGSCVEKASRELLDGGVTLRYVYLDKEGQEVSSFDLSRSDCGA